MIRTPLAVVCVTVIVLLPLSAPRAAAQAPFFGGAAIFDPEIDVVESGMILDAQATVSADRKYVTITSRVQNAQLLAIREFAFQVGAGGGGQVGGPPQFGAAAGAGGAGTGAEGATGAGNGARSRTATNNVQHSQSRKPYPKPGNAVISAGTQSVLEKPGMTLVGKIQPRTDG